MPQSRAPMRSRRTYRAPVVVDVQESAEPTDPADVFVSRRERMEAERSRSTHRKRVVVKPARAPRVRPDRQRPVRERAVVERPVVERAVRRAPRPEPVGAAHPRRGMFRRVHAPNGKRMGFQAVVLLALAAFFGHRSAPPHTPPRAEGSYVGNARTALAVQTLRRARWRHRRLSPRLGIASEPADTLDATTNNGLFSASVQALAVHIDWRRSAFGRLIGYYAQPHPRDRQPRRGQGRAQLRRRLPRPPGRSRWPSSNFSQVGVQRHQPALHGPDRGRRQRRPRTTPTVGGTPSTSTSLNGSALTGGDPAVVGAHPHPRPARAERRRARVRSECRSSISPLRTSSRSTTRATTCTSTSSTPTPRPSRATDPSAYSLLLYSGDRHIPGPVAPLFRRNRCIAAACTPASIRPFRHDRMGSSCTSRTAQEPTSPYSPAYTGHLSREALPDKRMPERPAAAERVPLHPRRAAARRQLAAEPGHLRHHLDGPGGRQADGRVVRQEHDRQGGVPATAAIESRCVEHGGRPVQRAGAHGDARPASRRSDPARR